MNTFVVKHQLQIRQLSKYSKTNSRQKCQPIHQLLLPSNDPKQDRRLQRDVEPPIFHMLSDTRHLLSRVAGTRPPSDSANVFNG